MYRLKILNTMESEKNLSVQSRFRAAQPGDEPLADQELKRAAKVSQGLQREKVEGMAEGQRNS